MSVEEELDLFQNFSVTEFSLEDCRSLQKEKETEEVVDSCPICLEPMTKKLGVVVPCGHVLHASCYRKWSRHCRSEFGTNQRCPSCSQPATRFQKMYLTIPTADNNNNNNKCKRATASLGTGSPVSLEDYGSLYMRVHNLSDRIQEQERVLKATLDENVRLHESIAQLESSLATTRQDLERQTQRNQGLEKTIEDTQSKYRDAKKRQSKLKSNMNHLRFEKDLLLTRIHSLESDMSSKCADLESIASEHRDLKDKYKRKTRKLRHVQSKIKE